MSGPDFTVSRYDIIMLKPYDKFKTRIFLFFPRFFFRWYDIILEPDRYNLSYGEPEL